METKMLLKDESLWNRIQGFSLDASDADFPFSKKLAKEENWSLEFTRKAIEEYKKFVYLCCILPKGASPSEIVDKVWHLHLIYTQNYWEEFCPKILKKPLHHHPSKGGFNEKLKHQNWFTDTLKSYQDIFQAEAPRDIWLNRNTIDKTKNKLRIGKFILFLMLILLLTSCLGEVITTIGSIFFSFVGILVFGGIIASIKKFKDKNDGNSDSSCGGSSCSGGSSCGGGCGGGCGGCGGCGG
ncbi:glycine-rich domain-containing protein [Chryseobacterium bernardetii]|uniref:glycine-rich domain-containing protein n=1 Tax=Chryseobacterium bernardetii TaxID=1241978 RepID=UPI003AF9AAB6